MRQILCYGDSNTWGLIPGASNRYSWGVRWTSVLQELLSDDDVRIIEEGLCGRTTAFDDTYRDSRNGLETLPFILESHSPIDYVIIMLGTNDCKECYEPDADRICDGLSRCVDKIREVIAAERIIIVSPIHLGDDVWKDGYDPEFAPESVGVSKRLAGKYEQLATEKGSHFIDASSVAVPSAVDQEHMDEDGHRKLAHTIYDRLKRLL